MFIFSLFSTFIYEPFLNVLLFFYWLTDIFTLGHPDMGIAVIMLTIFVRMILMPMYLAGKKTEKERRKISCKMEEIQKYQEKDPILFEKHKKELMKESRPRIVGELINLIVQIIIVVMLWEMFAGGVTGEDADLIYSFMPEIRTPLNLMFLGKYDLTRPDLTLNLIQSILIFILETISVYTSPYPHTRKEVVRLQLVLPVVSFFIFMFAPAGKKLFVITSLCISIILTLVMAIKRKFDDNGEDNDSEVEAAKNK